MRIVLASLGTLGDVHPFIAVALALKAAGHQPVFAGAKSACPLAKRHGIAFHPVRPDGADVMAETGLDEVAAARAVVDDLGFAVNCVILPHADATLADLRAALAGADLVLASSFSVLARIAAAAAGVPVWSLLLQPMTLFSADDPPVMPNGSKALVSVRRRLGAGAVRPLLALGRWLGRAQSAPFAAIRVDAGAPPFEGHELIDGPLAAERVFALWSPELAPLPADAGANVVQAGFTFYDEGFAGAGVSAGLEAFLAAGPPPVVATLGSLAPYAEEGFYAATAAAVRAVGRRAVLLVGDDLVLQHRHLAGPDIRVEGYAPHGALFARAAAVIHHGGVGTVAQAMRAGLPQIVCPIFGDQFDNAARLERRGIARVLPHRRYFAEAAAALLGEVDALRFAAEEVATRVRAEDGAAMVTRAVDAGQANARPAKPDGRLR